MDGDYREGCDTKKIVDGFGLEGELRLKSYVDVLIGTTKGVTFGDRGIFGLEGENISASIKLAMCDGSNSMTQKKTHHIENNIKDAIKGN